MMECASLLDGTSTSTSSWVSMTALSSGVISSSLTVPTSSCTLFPSEHSSLSIFRLESEFGIGDAEDEVEVEFEVEVELIPMELRTVSEVRTLECSLMSEERRGEKGVEEDGIGLIGWERSEYVIGLNRLNDVAVF